MARLPVTILAVILVLGGGTRVARAQALQAYGFAGPGSVMSASQTERSVQFGGGLTLLATNRLGVSLEIGEMRVVNLVFGNVSIDGVYHWAHPHRRIEPFVAGGYSQFFTTHTRLETLNFGGGVHVWMPSGAAVRLEVRDHVYPRLRNAQALSFRAGVAFRLTNRIW